MLDPYLLINVVPKSHPVCCMIKWAQIQSNTQHSDKYLWWVKKKNYSFSSLPINIKTTRVSLHTSKYSGQEFNDNPPKDVILDEDIEFGSYSSSDEDNGGISPDEMLRRRRIGEANKGKSPWNKGKKLDEEAREMIRQRMIEAWRDPEFKKKMIESRSLPRRSRSEQRKERISASLKRIWRERKKAKEKWKKAEEKFLQLWVESIANSAKKGGIDQDELDWDTAETKMAQTRGARAARNAEKQKERKQERKEEEKLPIAQELKLKSKLKRIHRKKPSKVQVTSQDSRTWESIDMEFIKKEMIQNQISLAEQIRSAKNDQAQVTGRQNTSTSCIYPPNESPVD